MRRFFRARTAMLFFRIPVRTGALAFAAFTTIFVPSFGFKRDQQNPFNFYDDMGHRRPWTKHALYDYVYKCGLKINKVSCTRNGLRVPINLIGIVWGLLKGSRTEVIRHFWNLYGWNTYAIGEKW